MGFRFRKSFRIAPGIRVNISKKGLSSLSIGGRGATVNVKADGESRVTVGIPGTGMSYSERIGGEGDAGGGAPASSGSELGPVTTFILLLGAMAFLYLFLR